ncbi:MAG: sensor histidine kinase [Dechloromonas sp.]|nr:sensor histidine kinase [Candidatus Dechloromonas phosphoritropha]MBP8786193.1 sensor histidine kinase [Azonexus sp.]MBP9226627.1 sensor histidine kinase [Azonexus sp.]
MTQVVIPIPASLDLPSALDFSVFLSKIERADEYVFDFSRTRTVEPFPMLLVSSEIQRLAMRFEGTNTACSNFKHMTYAGHMGFFQAFGLEFGKAPGEANGSKRYIPLKIFHCDDLIKAAAAKGIEVGDEVEGESQHMAAMLCGSDSGAVFDTLTYSVRELMRNVVEHSEAKQFGICAQYWPTKGRVEVAILDRGIGLRESLKNNPHLDVTDDKRAINYALMPAVSGKAFKGARQKQKGPWANSGFGLYMTSRICRNGGTFFVASGDKGMLLTKKTEAKRYFDSAFQGTAIRMVVRTDQLSELRDALEKYRNEGYEIQRRYKEIVSIDPSSASLMLSEDFDLGVWERLLNKLKTKL